VALITYKVASFKFCIISCLPTSSCSLQQGNYRYQTPSQSGADPWRVILSLSIFDARVTMRITYLVLWSDLVTVGPRYVSYAAESCQIFVAVFILTVVAVSATNTKLIDSRSTHCISPLWLQASAVKCGRGTFDGRWDGPNVTDNIYNTI